MKQALDFLEDSHQLFKLLKDKSNEDFKIKTQFKNWTINDVIGHLYIFNFATNLSLKSSSEFEILAKSIDGNIEAMSHKKLPWEAWMWHPERDKEFNIYCINRVKQLFNRHLKLNYKENYHALLKEHKVDNFLYY